MNGAKSIYKQTKVTITGIFGTWKAIALFCYQTAAYWLSEGSLKEPT